MVPILLTLTQKILILFLILILIYLSRDMRQRLRMEAVEHITSELEDRSTMLIKHLRHIFALVEFLTVVYDIEDTNYLIKFSPDPKLAGCVTQPPVTLTVHNVLFVQYDAPVSKILGVFFWNVDSVLL